MKKREFDSEWNAWALAQPETLLPQEVLEKAHELIIDFCEQNSIDVNIVDENEEVTAEDRMFPLKALKFYLGLE